LAAQRVNAVPGHSRQQVAKRTSQVKEEDVRTATKITAAAASLALALAPAAAFAQGSSGTRGNSSNAPGHTKTGSSSTPPSNAKAYGKYCQSESKQHVAGQPGTPFSTCVKDMAQLAKSSKANPHVVCMNETKKHVAGQAGTPYSNCVAAAAKLRRHGAPSSTS
jgi:hypothetical protein